MAMWTGAKELWRRVGPRARDLAFIVIALMASLAETLARRHHGTWEWSSILLVGLIGTAALWWRRKAPVVVTAIGMAVFAVTQVPVTMSVGLFSLAVRRRDRVLVVMTLCTAATFAIVPAIGSSSSWVGFAISGLLSAGFFAVAGSYVGARRDLVASLRERAERAEDERELRAEQAKLGERARIAREMHDVLAHKVSLIALYSGALEVNPTADAAKIHETVGLIRTTAREAMEDLRDVLGVLRSEADSDGADLLPPPRSADIRRVVEASRAAGIHTELTMDVAELPDATARTVYRVVQEGLTNVHKHARGAATSVSVTGDDAKGVAVEVVNQCPVGSAALLPGSGSGLLGLRERIMLLGGSLHAGPCADGGWRLAAWLPWPVADAKSDAGGAA
jgi:signal transduction histidine kinase